MPRRLRVPAGPWVAQVTFTDRTDGDLAVDAPPPQLAVRRAAVAEPPWTWLRQVHGASVVVVAEPGGHAGAEADAAATAVPGVALAVHAADCATVVLVGEGAVAAAHAGWRGLADGVVEAAATAVRSLAGGGRVRALLGPCIGVECYEFGPDDLAHVVGRLGPDVRGETSAGTPALDLRAGVRAALGRAGVDVVHADDRCTACTVGADGPALFSHRARGDLGRHAAVVRLGPAAAGPGARGDGGGGGR